jgi:hypothetical protein
MESVQGKERNAINEEGKQVGPKGPFLSPAEGNQSNQDFNK